MARRYILENGLNRIVVDSPRPWLGIVAGGHVCEEALDALATLGLDAGALAEMGVRVLKLGALNPFDADVRAPAWPPAPGRCSWWRTRPPSSRPWCGTRCTGEPTNPSCSASADVDGAGARPVDGRAHGRAVGRALAAGVDHRGAGRAVGAASARRRDRWSPSVPSPSARRSSAPAAPTTPARSSRRGHWSAPASAATAWSASWAAARGARSPASPRWAAREASGSASLRSSATLICSRTSATARSSTPASSSIQAAVAAGVDITFKLLYNAAVAMTGGQDATGLLPVPDVATKLLSEGVKEVVITTDEPRQVPGRRAPQGRRACCTGIASSRPRSTCARSRA